MIENVMRVIACALKLKLQENLRRRQPRHQCCLR